MRVISADGSLVDTTKPSIVVVWRTFLHEQPSPPLQTRTSLGFNNNIKCSGTINPLVRRQGCCSKAVTQLRTKYELDRAQRESSALLGLTSSAASWIFSLVSLPE